MGRNLGRYSFTSSLLEYKQHELVCLDVLDNVLHLPYRNVNVYIQAGTSCTTARFTSTVSEYKRLPSAIASDESLVLHLPYRNINVAMPLSLLVLVAFYIYRIGI